MKWRPRTFVVIAFSVLLATGWFSQSFFISPDSIPSEDLTVWEEAVLCAELSAFVYLKNENGDLERQFERLGFSSVETFERDGLRACVCKDDTKVAVVFRGSDNLRNWITNIKIASKPLKTGSVHFGFHESTMKFYDDITKRISDFGGKKKKLIVTGHSLGGAMALLYAYEATIRNDLEVSSLITFGQPLCLDKGIAVEVQSLFQERYRRFVNEKDPVTRLIPTFKHTGVRLHLTETGVRVNKPVMSSKNVDAAQSSEAMSVEEFHYFKAAPGSFGIANGQFKGNVPFIADHAMKEYVSKINKFRAELESKLAESSTADEKVITPPVFVWKKKPATVRDFGRMW